MLLLIIPLIEVTRFCHTYHTDDVILSGPKIRATLKFLFVELGCHAVIGLEIFLNKICKVKRDVGFIGQFRIAKN